MHDSPVLWQYSKSTAEQCFSFSGIFSVFSHGRKIFSLVLIQADANPTCCFHSHVQNLFVVTPACALIDPNHFKGTCFSRCFEKKILCFLGKKVTRQKVLLDMLILSDWIYFQKVEKKTQELQFLGQDRLLNV